MEDDRTDVPLDEIAIEPEPTTGLGADISTEAEPLTVGGGDEMKSTKRKKSKATGRAKATKKVRKIVPPKVRAKAQKVVRPKKARTTPNAVSGAKPTRVTSDAIFSYVGGKAEEQINERGRERAILNAAKRLGSGTAADVAKAVTRSDYDGEMPEWCAARFLREMLKSSIVSVEIPEKS